MENPERGGWARFKAWTDRSLRSTPRERLSMRGGHFLGLSPGGFHRIAYVIWGEPGRAPPVVCVHGLTRNGRDFDRLAAALESDRLVIVPDIVGRGASSWLADAGGYAYPQYCADMAALIVRLGDPVQPADPGILDAHHRGLAVEQLYVAVGDHQRHQMASADGGDGRGMN